MISRPKPSARSRKRNWWIPISPVTCVKKVSGSSRIGWKPTKPPMRGYISSTGMVACPQPKVCTQRPAAIDADMTRAAARILSSCVASMALITARALPSHCRARGSVIPLTVILRASRRRCAHHAWRLDVRSRRPTANADDADCSDYAEKERHRSTPFRSSISVLSVISG